MKISDITEKERGFMANIMTVRASDELRESLKHLATEKGLTRNALILQILWEWMENRKREEKEDISKTEQGTSL